MSKQILYPGFLVRAVSLLVDLFLISLIIAPINQWLNPFIFKKIFAEFLYKNNITSVDLNAMVELFKDTNFQSQVVFNDFILFIFLINLAYIIFFFVYLVIMQTIYSYSFGQKLLALKIVDYKTFEKASMWQIINRSIFIWLGLISLPVVIFSKQKRGLHDIISSTVVIKR